MSKPKLSDVLMRGEVGTTFEAYTHHLGVRWRGHLSDDIQFDELLDYVVEELGVDPSEIIKRMEFHLKSKLAKTVTK